MYLLIPILGSPCHSLILGKMESSSLLIDHISFCLLHISAIFLNTPPSLP